MGAKNSAKSIKNRLVIAMGDPAGIGPEIIVKALAAFDRKAPAIIVTGSVEAFESAARLVEFRQDFTTLSLPDAHLVGDDGPRVVLVEVNPEIASPPLGQITEAGGHLAYTAAKYAVELVESGVADGLVTAPLSKEALHRAGHNFAGYTEMLAHLTNSPDSVMLLVCENLRVSHISTHLPIVDVPKKLTAERLRRVIELTHEAVMDFGVSAPRIAVAALNPHGGEGGVFGCEDIEISAPLIGRMNDEGYRVDGPVPGDTVFVKAVGGYYDAVVAMYHDQGHIPLKLLGFSIDRETGQWMSLKGVNVTLGLPIIRTSVDHGTAFDIAGKGIANEESLLDAIDVAMTLTLARHHRLDRSRVPEKSETGAKNLEPDTENRQRREK